MPGLQVFGGQGIPTGDGSCTVIGGERCSKATENADSPFSGDQNVWLPNFQKKFFILDHHHAFQNTTQYKLQCLFLLKKFPKR
jgi:hypothetical protein